MKIHKLNLLLNLLFQNLIREIENRPLNSIELRNALNNVIQLGNEASSFSGAVTNMCTLFSRYVSIFICNEVPKISKNRRRQFILRIYVLYNVIVFGSNLNKARSSICREGGIRLLLSFCNGSRAGNNLNSPSSTVTRLPPPEIRILALRGLGAICCVAECIRQFESVIEYQ